MLEWPPSPYRLLRAITAVGLHRTEHDEESLNTLLNALCERPPAIACVPVTQMQTRHYMPPYKGNTVKILDTAAVVGRPLAHESAVGSESGDAPAYDAAFRWSELSLSAGSTAVLRDIVSRMTYFGRAESWATVSAYDREVTTPRAMVTMVPAGTEAASTRTGEGELQSYPYPLPELVLADWNQRWLDSAVERELAAERRRNEDKGREFEEKKRRKPIEKKLQSMVRGRIVDVLMAETGDLQKEGWSRPPGTYDVRYRRPASLMLSSRPLPPAVEDAVKPVLARLQITDRVLPPLGQSLWLAESLRAALIEWTQAFYPDQRFRDMNSLPEQLRGLLGKSEDGTASSEGHNHLHIFCEPDSRGVAIASFLVFMPTTIPETVQLALRTTGRKLWLSYPRHAGSGEASGTGESGPSRANEGRGWNVALTWMGTLEEMPPAARSASPFGTSRAWVSLTPFVSTRHPKERRLEVLPDHVTLVAAPAGSGDHETPLYGRLPERQSPPEDGRAVLKGDAVSDLLRLLQENHLDEWQKLEKLVVLSSVPVAIGERQNRHQRRPLAVAEFRLDRRFGAARRGQGAAAFELHFREPVTGPFALGYGAHFSLGVLRPFTLN
jgi:CRISPR-associated protein Csb2